MQQGRAAIVSRADASCTLRFTCPPCGDVFSAGDEDALISTAVEHARRLHDVDLLAQFSREQLHALVRRENESYWSRISHLVPEEERLCDREREIVAYVIHGFTNREIAQRLCISGRTVSTHLVNIYDKLNVHSRAELTVLVRAADRIIEAGLRSDTKEFGPFTRANGP